ncbi:phospholipase D/nuclease [Tricholoma matsutake]|nr:phospholipase D/nuclease [Tricholoma matsutake 945]
MSMNANEKDDIAIAIALSLQEAGSKHAVIDLVTDDEDDDSNEDTARFQVEIERAIAASKAESSRQHAAMDVAPSDPQLTVPGASAFLSERAQLEKARLERQKRLRPEASLDDNNYGDDSDDDATVREPPAKRQHLSLSSGSRTNNDSTRPVLSTSNGSTSQHTIDQVFWDGEFRQTATRHADPRKDGRPTFRLTEVLGQKADLSFAIMSSYSLDFSWIYEFFDRSVPVIMIAQPDETGQASLKNVLPNWIKTAPTLRGGRGCQHMKASRLRVVVSTANLIAYDWRDMENTVWLQDVQLRSSPIAHDPKATDDFAAVLQRVLHSMHVRSALSTMISDNHPDLPLKSIDELRMRWDWSKVKAHLVPSIAGRHEGWPDVIRTGHPRLMKVVRNMSMRTSRGKGKELVLECQGSSLGIYTTQWFNEFYWSARGESAEEWLDEPKKRREQFPYPPIKLVFPTKLTGGGTIFCRRKQWAAKNFPRDRFYDSRSKAGPVLMHSKMIVATYRDVPSLGKGKRPEDSETEDDSDDEIEMIQPAIGWAYIGSHNFTPSAWGTLSGSSFNPTLTLRERRISNYELGVVFPLKDEAQVNRTACWDRPPKKYVSGRDEPWEESAYHQDG